MRTILVVDDDPAFLNETQNVLGGAGLPRTASS
jgi:hypothetical protein